MNKKRYQEKKHCLRDKGSREVAYTAQAFCDREKENAKIPLAGLKTRPMSTAFEGKNPMILDGLELDQGRDRQS